MSDVRGESRAPGEFRRVQNYIAAPGATIEEATFVPPPPNEVPRLLDELEKYMHAEERDPIVQVGLIHARFEAIHPFLDGNGRVGRILVPLFLYAREVIGRPAFYVSAWLEAHRSEYYDRLTAITSEGDHAGWVRFFLRAVTAQAEEDTRRVREILALYERTKDAVVEVTRSRYAVAATEALFGQPIFSTPGFVAESWIPPATAARLLDRLEAARILRTVRRGRGRRPTSGRSRSWWRSWDEREGGFESQRLHVLDELVERLPPPLVEPHLDARGREGTLSMVDAKSSRDPPQPQEAEWPGPRS
jgi:Fic family protein